MSRNSTAGNPGRRGRAAEEEERPDKRDGFGGLAAAADKNATFCVHSQPVYKMAHNCSVAMSNAHLPKHALAVFGEATQCTEFVGRALDMIPHGFGGHPEPTPGYIPDTATLEVARAVTAYRATLRPSLGGTAPPSGGTEGTRSRTSSAPSMSPAASPSSPSPERAVINAWRRKGVSLDFDIAGLHDSMARLTASLGLNESARHKFADVARDQRASAAKDEDLTSRRERNEATAQQERALTAEHKKDSPGSTIGPTF